MPKPKGQIFQTRMTSLDKMDYIFLVVIKVLFPEVFPIELRHIRRCAMLYNSVHWFYM
jgi:hypothetical protein